jgi:hypothetical protein
MPWPEAGTLKEGGRASTTSREAKTGPLRHVGRGDRDAERRGADVARGSCVEAGVTEQESLGRSTGEEDHASDEGIPPVVPQE